MNCPKCNGQIDPYCGFCPYCGKYIVPPAEPQPASRPNPTPAPSAPETQPQKKGGLGSTILSIVVALAIIGLLGNAFCRPWLTDENHIDMPDSLTSVHVETPSVSITVPSTKHYRISDSASSGSCFVTTFGSLVQSITFECSIHGTDAQQMAADFNTFAQSANTFTNLGAYCSLKDNTLTLSISANDLNQTQNSASAQFLAAFFGHYTNADGLIDANAFEQTLLSTGYSLS